MGFTNNQLHATFHQSNHYLEWEIPAGSLLGMPYKDSTHHIFLDQSIKRSAIFTSSCVWGPCYYELSCVCLCMYVSLAKMGVRGLGYFEDFYKEDFSFFKPINGPSMGLLFYDPGKKRHHSPFDFWKSNIVGHKTGVGINRPVLEACAPSNQLIDLAGVLCLHCLKFPYLQIRDHNTGCC